MMTIMQKICDSEEEKSHWGKENAIEGRIKWQQKIKANNENNKADSVVMQKDGSSLTFDTYFICIVNLFLDFTDGNVR